MKKHLKSIIGGGRDRFRDCYVSTLVDTRHLSKKQRAVLQFKSIYNKPKHCIPPSMTRGHGIVRVVLVIIVNGIVVVVTFKDIFIF